MSRRQRSPARKHRLGDMANTVHWIEGDVTQVQLAPYQYEVWHDRAVFHFLTAAEDRHAYLERLLGSVKPGAHIIMATFGLRASEMQWA